MTSLKILIDSGQLKTLAGNTIALSELAGRVVLFVNVASRCGLTPQYEGLVALQASRRSNGFTVIGVPCNQFGKQEPGTPQEIQNFCATSYGVDFPLLEKQNVNNPDRSDLYEWLVNSPAGGGKNVGWNFAKFLVGRDGSVIQRFQPTTAPDDDGLLGAIDGALAES
jgi:glutathione peroxidase-family protein